MLRLARALLPAALIVWVLSACGGSNDDGDGSNPPPGPGNGASNPCASASIEESIAAGQSSQGPDPALRRIKTERTDGNPRWRVLDALWTHRQHAQRQPASRTAAAEAGRNSFDIGEIAVLQDTGDLIIPPNELDLRNLGLRFSRNGSNGYDITRIDGTFRSGLGTRLTLTDDDSSQLNVPFPFPSATDRVAP